MKQKSVLIGAILVGMLAFFLTHRYLASERDRLYAGAEKIVVLAAARDLPPGTVLERDDVATLTVFKKAVGNNIFTTKDLNRILNKRLRYGLKRKTPVYWTHVEMPETGGSGLAPMIKSGRRAISIAVGGSATVSGLVQPNDRVDIIGTFTLPARDGSAVLETVTLTVLQDVTILATGQQLAKQEFSQSSGQGSRTRSYSMVTLEVTPREAELLVFTQNVKGDLTLSLRHPDDVGFETELPEINFERLESSLPEMNMYRQRVIRHKKNL